MSKKILTAAAGGLLLIVVFWFTCGPNSAKKGETSGSADISRHLGAEVTDANGEYAPWLVEQSLKLFAGQEPVPWAEVEKLAASGEINLVSELWRMRRSCENLPPEECALRIRVFLQKKFPPPDGAKVLKLYDSYLKYEEEMRAFRLPDGLTAPERYRLIREKRSAYFTAEESRLVFGYQDAQMDFAERGREFLKQTADMPGAERVNRFRELEKEVYGPYYEAMKKKEAPFKRYDTELTLREKDLSAMTDDGRKKSVEELRVRYFGREAAARMREVDQNLEKERSRIEGLEREEKQLRASGEFSSLSPEKQKVKINELRVRILGSEAAEEYTRRKALESAGFK